METESAVRFEPAEAVEFDTLEALDALMSPFRLRLMACFSSPATARQAADKLGVGVTRLYRHLDRLVEHGFLVIVEERAKAKTVERVFSVSARSVRPSAEFLERYGPQGHGEMMRLGFRTVESEVVAAVEADPSIDPLGDQTTFKFTRLRLEEEDLRELVAGLDDLFERFTGRTGPIEVSFLGSVVPLERDTSRHQGETT